MAEWDFQKSSGSCVVTELAFVEGDTIWSALFAHGSGLYRVDLSDSAWQERLAAGGDAPAIAIEIKRPDNEEIEVVQLEGEPIHFWSHVKAAADEKPKRRFVDDDILLEFFKKLEGTGEEQRRSFRYVLALHLIRRKMLLFVDVVRQGDDEYMILNEPKNDTVTYKVLDPKLDENQILALREQMDRVLDMDDELEASEESSGTGAQSA